MFDFNSHYALWRQGCSDRYHMMSDAELLGALIDDYSDQDNSCGWMYSFGYLISEMRERKWDISVLLTEKQDYKALPCILKNNILVPVKSYASREYIKKYILREFEKEKSIMPPEKKGLVSWLGNHLRKKVTKLTKATIPTSIPSFTIVCARHGKVDRYDKFRKYDMFIVNHSDMTYNYLLLGNDYCCGEDDMKIGPITPNSIHHICTTTREQLGSYYILDFYRHCGMKPISFMAEISEEKLYSRNRKFIKSLNQEGWTIELKRMEENT